MSQSSSTTHHTIGIDQLASAITESMARVVNANSGIRNDLLRYGGRFEFFIETNKGVANAGGLQGGGVSGGG